MPWIQSENNIMKICNKWVYKVAMSNLVYLPHNVDYSRLCLFFTMSINVKITGQP